MSAPNVELLDYNWGYRKLAVANVKIAELEDKVAEQAEGIGELIHERDRLTDKWSKLLDKSNEQAATIERMTKWISVDDDLPEPWVPVIVYDAAWNCRYIAMFDDEEKEWSATSDREPPQEITYWRHMPDFPVDAALSKQENDSAK